MKECSLLGVIYTISLVDGIHNAVKPRFYVLAFCVFHNFTHFSQGPSQIPIRTMFPQFYDFLDFVPCLGGFFTNIRSVFYVVSATAAAGQPMSNHGQHVCVHQTVIALSKHVT
jgi:hypothetical protein